MNNSASSAILAVIGVIIAASLIAVGVRAFQSGRTGAQTAALEETHNTETMGTHDYTKQDGQTVDGGKVIQYLQQYKDGDVALVVNNGRTIRSYVKSYSGSIDNAAGTVESSTISEFDEEGKKESDALIDYYITSTKDVPDSAKKYSSEGKQVIIEPDSAYAVKVVYNEENGAIEAALFNLDEETSNQNYTLNFYGNGATSGSVPSVRFKGKNFSYSLKQSTNAFKRTGYKFAGWSFSSNGAPLADNCTINHSTFGQNSHSLTVYALWTRNEDVRHSISYTAWDEKTHTGVSQEFKNSAPTKYYEGDTIEIPTPTRDGYEFKGWASNTSSSLARTYKITSSNKTDITLTANWKSSTYTVVFNGNGATRGSMSQMTMPTNAAKTLAKNAYTRDGYKFKGWALSKYETTVRYGDQQTITSPLATAGRTVTLYAVWQKNTYTIEYNSNNGTGSMSNQTATVDKNVTLSGNAFTKNGYTFLGWATSSTATSATYTNKQTVKNIGAPGSKVTLYAVWKAIQGNVVYHGNDGNVLHTEAVSSGSKFTAEDDLGMTMAHYQFIGWVSDTYESNAFAGTSMTSSIPGALYANAARQVTATKNKSETVTIQINPEYTKGKKYRTYFTKDDSRLDLYPVWIDASYTIRFYANGGSIHGSAGDQSYKQVVDAGTSFKLLANRFKRSGYTFVGWKTTDANGSEVLYRDQQTVSDLGTAGTTVSLIAKWSNATYTVTYNANGGYGEMANSVLGKGDSITLPDCTFAKTGYTFAGWSLTPAGSIDYNDNAVVRDLTSPGKHITLYAVWVKQFYRVRFDDGVADNTTLQQEVFNTMEDQVVEYDQNAHLNKNRYERFGYTFAGWVMKDRPEKSFKDEDYIRNLTDKQYDEKTGAGIVTLVAQWKANTYQVNFHAGYKPKSKSNDVYTFEDTAGNEYKVSGNMASVTYQYDKVYKLPAVTFTAQTEKYAFAGWARLDTDLIKKINSVTAYQQWRTHYGDCLSDDARRKIYNDQQTVTNMTPIPGGTVDLYALWVKTEATPDGYGPTPYPVTADGWYKLSVTGAQGGGNGGKGGHAEAVVYLRAGQTLYMTKGRQGAYVTSAQNKLSLLTGLYADGTYAGYNGGGLPTALKSKLFNGRTLYEGLTGGGASHISFTKTTIDKTTRKDLIIAAGGGAASYGKVRGGVGGNTSGEDGQ